MNNKEKSFTIYLQAKRFEHSASLLFEKTSVDPSFLIPALTLAALSLELYLKSILQFEKGKFAFTHNINSLFKELKEETKSKIKNEFNLSITTNPPHNINEIESKSGVKISDEIEETLENLSNLFIDFRYIFEIKNKERSFIYIDNFKEAISKTITYMNINKN